MDSKEFKNAILKRDQPREHSIKNSYGVYDYFKYYRRTKPENKKYIMNDHKYYSIINSVNAKIVERLLEGQEFTFPLRMGKLIICEKKFEPTLDKEGNLVYRAPIDWDSTLELWNEDEESFKNKTLVKMNPKTVIRIMYDKAGCTYKNKSYYVFQVNRQLKIDINEVAKNKKLTIFKQKSWRNNIAALK